MHASFLFNPPLFSVCCVSLLKELGARRLPVPSTILLAMMQFYNWWQDPQGRWYWQDWNGSWWPCDVPLAKHFYFEVEEGCPSHEENPVVLRPFILKLSILKSSRTGIDGRGRLAQVPHNRK